MTATRFGRRLAVAGPLLLTLVATPAALAAQRGGQQLTRLERLEAAFKMTGDQRKSVKAAFDQAGKDAAPIRDGLTTTRADLLAAIQAGRSPGEIEAASRAYAAEASAMTAIEMKAAADALTILDPDLKNPAGIQMLFFMVRGMFLGKGWDNIPDGKAY